MKKAIYYITCLLSINVLIGQELFIQNSDKNEAGAQFFEGAFM